MSNFIKQGKRQSLALDKKKTKKHVKEFYSIMSKLDNIAVELKASGVDITEDNVEAEAAKLMGRDIDSMEKFLLLGKLGSYEK